MLYKYPPKQPVGSQLVTYGMQLIPSESDMAQNSFKPTQVTVGMVEGFSLPISVGYDGEYLHTTSIIPPEWDRISNPIATMICAIDTANTNKNFKMRLDWVYFKPGWALGDPIVSTTGTTEMNTGIGTQYMVYKVEQELLRDAGGEEYILAPGDVFNINVRRTSAFSDEITGEVIVLAAFVKYWCSYYGSD